MTEQVEKEMCFEEAMTRLQEVASELEEGKVTLEDSLALYEEGVSLIRFCNRKLDEAEQRVEKIFSTENGISVEPFSEEKK